MSVAFETSNNSNPSTPTTNNKRKLEEENNTIGNPIGNTSGKIVPRVVAVDFDNVVVQQPPQKKANTNSAATPTPLTERSNVGSYLDWKLINNRAAIERVFRVGKMSKGKSGVGASQAFMDVDVLAYKEITGIDVHLGQFNHPKIRGPYMLNIFGLGKQVQKDTGKANYTICYDIKDCTMSAEVQLFAQFLAVVDDVLLDQCVKLSLNTSEVRNVIDWVRDSTDEQTGEIKMARLRDKVSRNFNSALRTTKKAKADPAFKGVVFDPNNRNAPPQIGDSFYFKTKVYPKRGNSNLAELSMTTVDDEMVFYGTVKELGVPRATYLECEYELPGVYWVGKEFHATWVTTRAKFQTVEAANSNAAATDFNGNALSQDVLDRLEREQMEYLKELENNPMEMAIAPEEC